MNEITIRQQTEITPILDLASFIPEWMIDLEKRVEAQEISADTATGYRRGVQRFMTDRISGNAASIRDWKAALLVSYKPATVNAWLSGVKSFFSWLAEKQEIPFNPTQAIKGAKRKGSNKHSRQALTDAEVKAVLSQPDRTTPEGTRDRAMLAVMLYTAARTIEIHRANLDDLRTEGGKLVLYVQGKGSNEKDEFLVITDEAETAIMEYLADRGKAPGALFVSLSNRSSGERLSRRAIRGAVKAHFMAAGVHGNKTTHSLRHTAITKAIRKSGGDVIRVQGMSRHASLDTLMIYSHEVDRIDHPAEELITYD